MPVHACRLLRRVPSERTPDDLCYLYCLASTPHSGPVMEAWLLIWVCRVGLWFAPFQKVLQFADRCADSFRSRSQLSPESLKRAMAAALPFSWRATCLTQSLAAWIMFTRRGISCRLKIGVASPAHDVFRAHAWLECGGEIVVGDTEIESYEVIWALPME